MRPDQIQVSIGAALQALQRGDVLRAEALAADVLKAVPREPTSLMIAGLAAHARGNLHAALDFLMRAEGAAPGNPMILGNLGVVLRALDRFSEARSAYEKALAADPKHIPTRTNLARLLDQMGDLTGAEAQFRAVVAVQPRHSDALAGLASVLEQRHRLDEAADAARRALAIGPSALAGLTLAKIAIRTQKPDEALTEISRIRGPSLSAINSALADGLEGQALELQGQHAAAFLAFSRANETLRTIYVSAYEGVRSIASSDLLSGLAQYFDQGAPEGFLEFNAQDQRPGHTFLLGFPRSGTTLMEQALAAHPDVQTLEEKDTLAAVLGDLVAAPSVNSFIAGLTPERVRHYRSAYWKSVDGFLGSSVPAKVFIDKMPINSAYLGLIAKLFPAAKFIFAVRDPRDVILSCFQQRFGMNAVMYQFLSLDGTAKLYDGAMQAALAARGAMSLRLHEIRYEALIADFEGELRRLTDFLDLEWRAEILDFRQKSKDRTISTPSAAQIMEPISTRPSGRFRSYLSELRPVLPTANAWAVKFGYPAA